MVILGISRPVYRCFDAIFIGDFHRQLVFSIARLSQVNISCIWGAGEYLMCTTASAILWVVCCIQEQRALQQEIFGPMQPVTDADYIRIYQATGIDIDDRREILQNDILAQIETCVKRIVTFVKAIPGFTRLPMDDQIALVKGIEC